jgi:uncharacterized protein YcaQ
MDQKSYLIAPATARRAWLHAQRLDVPAPFGPGLDAVRQAVEHLGYVQIDTINVIERSHHHILYSRIPSYQRTDLEQAQSVDKSVFEYWTHALAFLPTSDYRLFALAMERFRVRPDSSFGSVDREDYIALLRRIREAGALSIRDIDDDVLVEKTHPWGSRKPSRRALRYGFFIGDLTVSKRVGMLKTYELADRHFGWRRKPQPATESQYAAYLLRRATRSQGVVSLDSICYGNLWAKPAVAELIGLQVKRKRLVPLHLEGLEKVQYWAEPATLEERATDVPLVHILSPFDPLVIQRKRLKMLFGYEHRFEAYVPAEKRTLGYFALPILVDDQIVAAVDFKTDRQARKLLVQKWTWFTDGHASLKGPMDEALSRFERFQLGAPGETERPLRSITAE